MLFTRLKLRCLLSRPPHKELICFQTVTERRADFTGRSGGKVCASALKQQRKEEREKSLRKRERKLSNSTLEMLAPSAATAPSASASRPPAQSRFTCDLNWWIPEAPREPRFLVFRTYTGAVLCQAVREQLADKEPLH